MADDTAGEKLSKGTILFVDDDLGVRETMNDVLSLMGYRAICCASGDAALSYYKRNAYEIDVVILDLVMPGMDGLDTFAALKAVREDVCAFLYTGHLADERCEKGKAMGFFDVLKKPARLKSLMHSLERATHPEIR